MKLERYECDFIDRGKAHGMVEHLLRKEDDATRNYVWTLREDHVLVRRNGAFDLSHLTGQRINFSIDALASRSSQNRAEKTRKRTYVTAHADRKEWIERQLFERAGLAPVAVNIGPIIAPTVHSKGQSFKKPGARYTGTALVVRPELLADALNKGIGDGKAYGFGMLIIEEN